MTYVIAEPCVDLLDKACIEECPVDCIYGKNEDWEMLYIHPEECIDCGLCVDACPVEAIELTGFYDLTGLSREQMIFDKAKLLSVFDVTKDAEPMRFSMGPGAGLPVTPDTPARP